MKVPSSIANKPYAVLAWHTLMQAEKDIRSKWVSLVHKDTAIEFVNGKSYVGGLCRDIVSVAMGGSRCAS